MLKIYKLIIILLLFAKSEFSQTGTFDFDSSPNRSGAPQIVTQTVSSVTLTVSDNGTNGTNYANAGGWWGTSSNICYSLSNNVSQVVLTFSSNVNIGSLRAGEYDQNNYTWIFTPNTGTAVTQAVDGSHSGGTSVNFGN